LVAIAQQWFNVVHACGNDGQELLAAALQHAIVFSTRR